MNRIPFGSLVTAVTMLASVRLLGREIGEKLRAAVLGLPATQRAAFVLRHYDELSLEEIAAALRIRLGTVKSSLHRAVHRLRAELEGVRA